MNGATDLGENAHKVVMTEGEWIEVPSEVAVCPYCESALTVCVEGASFDRRASCWVADDIASDCASEPDMDSPEWDEWIEHHTYMPYVYMLPVHETILRWINSNYIIA